LQNFSCGGDGNMNCDPRVCSPEPMLRQMIAATTDAKRRRWAAELDRGLHFYKEPYTRVKMLTARKNSVLYKSELKLF